MDPCDKHRGDGEDLNLAILFKTKTAPGFPEAVC